MTDSPFGDALAQLSQTGVRGGLLVRVDETGTAKAVVAWKNGGGFSIGAEFTYNLKTRKPAGWAGVELEFR